jgi:hypothetical protein
MRVVAYPHGVFITRNLTSDKETGLGRWTEPQIINALRNGRAPDRLVSKLTRRFPAADVTVLTYAGNFGRIDSRTPWAQLQTTLIDAQWIVLIIGAPLFTFTAPREEPISSRSAWMARSCHRFICSKRQKEQGNTALGKKSQAGWLKIKEQ